MKNEQKQFQCSGDCLKCIPIQRQYCSAQHSYNSMRMLQQMQESLDAMAVEFKELKEKVAAIQDGEAMLFNPNLENEAQEGDGAEE